ncbi:hypothetical protein HMPREF1640_03050 [Prevotella sp. S7-1-8]|jgi:hypothetical protein|nr:hypothetical protein HMPREF1640_03050 [Prevotella sp. S7-1-8]
MPPTARGGVGKRNHNGEWERAASGEEFASGRAVVAATGMDARERERKVARAGCKRESRR